MKALYSLVGMKYRGTGPLVASLTIGEPLELRREPENPHDPNAVQIWARGQHVAYVLGNQAKHLAPRMDAAGQTTIVGKLAADRTPQIEIEEERDGNSK